MSLRISSAACGAAAMLAACSPSGDQRRQVPQPPAAMPISAATPAREEPVRIACARGDAPLATVCVLDEGVGEGALVVRFPDGGFRRITVTGDGRGVVTADGAQPARVTMVESGQAGGAAIEVRIGDDRFRLPVRGGAGAR